MFSSRVRFWALVLPLLTPCIGSDPALSRWAWASPPQAMNFTVEGRIDRLDPGKFTLSTEENIIFHVRYGDKTEIKRKDGTAGSAKDLRVGLGVRVDGDLTESGEILAQKIVIQQEPAGKQSS